MRVAADGYIDVRDGRRVRTPGNYDPSVEPVPEAEALSFLLSHSFPGHRRIVRPLSATHLKRLRMALWADSVSERMARVDRVWRAITEPALPPPDPSEPYLIQVVAFGPWAYPVYLDGSVTRVLPHGGLPAAEIHGHAPTLRLERTTT